MVFTLDGIDDGAAEAKEERRLFMPKLAGPCRLYCVGRRWYDCGCAIGGAAEYKQQQNALAVINGGGGAGAHSSKAGK